MVKTEELVDELSATVEEFDEYDELVEAGEEYESNEVAQELLAELRRLENEIQRARNEGESHESLHEEHSETQEELNSLDVVQAYYEAADEFQDRLDEEFNQHLNDMPFDLAV